MIEVNQYLEIFIEESKEHLQNLNQSLLQLEQNPENIPTLNEIFRSAHTLKGMSGIMGYTKMASLTHKMEDVLDALRCSKIKASTKILDIMFKSLDALENYVGCIANNSNEGSSDCSDLLNSLEGILSNNGNENNKKQAVSQKSASSNDNSCESDKLIGKDELDIYTQSVINNVNESGMNAFRIKITLSNTCVLKAARVFIIFQTLESISDIIKSIPSTEEIEDEKFDLEFELFIATDKSEEELKSEFDSISEIEHIKIVKLESKSVTESASIETNYKKITNDTEKTNDTSDKKVQVSVNTRPKAGKTVRVDIDRLDNLMNLVSELIIIKTRLEGSSKRKEMRSENEAIEYLERITTNLHDAVMKVRMVSVETVFNRFPRMIRDVSKELGKEITLSMSGEETELDRTVIDEIGDPLVHLLRNSADHGIESLQQRIDQKKSEEGHIFLRAYQDGNNVVIEVEDDGQGIDVERVRKKIVDKEIVSIEAAKSLSKKDLIDYLFKPSFSTTDKITDLSGRGVGLDVVKTKIEALGGSVEVDSEMGKGSKFIIRLPLTLAIIQALLVFVGEEKYAIPLNSVHQIIKINTDEIKTIQKQEVIVYRNSVVPIIRLGKVLEVSGLESDQKQLTVVIVKKRDRMSGFLINGLIGRQEIVVKSLGKLISGIKYIAGATILGDGNVALILDTNSIA